MRKQIIAFILLFAVGLEAAEKIQQCTCEQQQKCIKEMKEEVEGCMDECEISVDFKSVVNESNNIGPCMEKRKVTVLRLYDCIHNECSLKDSCLKGKENKQVEGIDFEALVTKYIGIAADKAINKFKEMGTGMNSEFVDVASEMNKCSKDCAMKKLQNLNCLQKQKCGLKVTDQEVKQTVQKCFKNMGPKESMVDICQCFEKSGVKNLTQFCEKLQKAEIPTDI